jgi:hypothetical protein
MSAYPNQRWLIQTDEGDLLLIDDEDHLAQLLGSGRVTGTASVYEVGPGPRTLAQVPDLARVLSKAVSSEPPPRHVRRSPEHAALSDELSLLDRPLDYEIEYYDPPGKRWVRWVALLVGLAAASFGAYVFALPRYPELRSLVMTRLIRPVSEAAHLASSPPAPPAAAPAPAPAAAPVPAPIGPAAIQTSPPPAPPAEAAPAAAPEAPAAEADEPVHPAKRHSMKKRSRR